MANQVDKPQSSEPPTRASRVSGVVLRVVVVMTGFVMLAAGLWAYRESLAADMARTGPPLKVRLVDISRKLPAGRARQVQAAVQQAVAGRGPLDADVTRLVYDKASGEVWVARVHRVTLRGGGEVRVEADYRRPFALVAFETATRSGAAVVDEQGVVLPVRVDSRLHRRFMEISGVRSAPPAPGRRWAAGDLADGLKALKLIRGRPYYKDFSRIDVRNHGGRIDPTEPHVRMWAQTGRGRRTDVRFGRFPVDGDDYCRSPATRIQWLDGVVAEHEGRLAGIRDWIDLRYDKPYVSVN